MKFPLPKITARHVSHIRRHARELQSAGWVIGYDPEKLMMVAADIGWDREIAKLAIDAPIQTFEVFREIADEYSTDQALPVTFRFFD